MPPIITHRSNYSLTTAQARHCRARLYPATSGLSGQGLAGQNKRERADLNNTGNFKYKKIVDNSNEYISQGVFSVPGALCWA